MAQPAGGVSLPSQAVLATVGLITLLGQVLLLRELLVASFGSELVYLVGLALLLAGTAAGASLGRMLRGTPGVVGCLLLGLAVSLPLLAAFARTQRALLGALPGTLQSPQAQFAGLSLTLLPFGLLGGALFAASARLHLARGGTVGSAYAWESAGGVLGGLGATLLLAAGLSGAGGVLLSALPAAGLAALLSGGRLPRVLAAAWTVAALGLLPAAERIDLAVASIHHPGVATVTETPYGRLQVEEAGGQVSFFMNGALVSETQGTSAEEFVHVSAIQVRSLQRVLLVGGALEGLPAELLKHHPDSVDLVELDGRALRAAQPSMPPEWKAALSMPTLHLRVADPRRVLREGGPWDLILVGMPEPDSGLTNRYYTREFFVECASKLAPGGLLALRLRGSENLWTPLWAQRAASVDAALGEAFPHRLVLPGSTLLLLASHLPLLRDPELLSERWRARAIPARLVSPPYLSYLLTNDRVEEVRRMLDGISPVPNSDARPVCYPATLALWAARLMPGISNQTMPSPPSGLCLLGSSLLLSLVLTTGGFFLRRRPGPTALLLAGGAGAGGMALEGALLLAYQVRYGSLYQDVGILLMSFMGGLALGSALGARREARRVQIFSLALLAGCSLGAAGLWATPHWPGLVTTLALMLGTGGATGALFASAASRCAPDSLGTLYASDLAGGIAGALLTGLYLIPFTGLHSTALLVAVFAGALLPLGWRSARSLAGGPASVP